MTGQIKPRHFDSGKYVNEETRCLRVIFSALGRRLTPKIEPHRVQYLLNKFVFDGITVSLHPHRSSIASKLNGKMSRF